MQATGVNLSEILLLYPTLPSHFLPHLSPFNENLAIGARGAPIGSWRSPAAKLILVHSEPKMAYPEGW